MKTLQNLFLEELADMYDAEHRIVKALPKLAKAATCPDLQAALLTHLEETKGQITKLDQVFASFGKKARGKKCEATVGLLQEAAEIAADNRGEPTLNAALISAAQKVEHYEIASYHCLHAWTLLLENQKAADLIQEILEQEEDANDTLIDLSDSNNREALGNSESKTTPGRGRATGAKPSSRARTAIKTKTVATAKKK